MSDFLIDRRKALLGGAATALSFPAIANTKLKFGHFIAPGGWQTLKINGGGFMTGIHSANDGKKVSKGDVANGFVLNGTTWEALISKTSLGDPNAAVTNGDTGMWEVDICKGNSNYIYCVFSNVSGGDWYNVYKSSDGGATFAPVGDSSFRLYKTSLNPVYTLNGWKWRLSNRKLIVDPNNPNVVYCGTIAFGQIYNGIWRSIDGGATWAQVTDIPGPAKFAGCCGLAFDASSGTVTGIGGLTVTKRIMLNSGGKGSWLSEDGGLTWTQVAADPTPSTTLSYTTTTNDCVLLLMAQTGGQNTVKSITVSGGLTAVPRQQYTFNEHYNVGLSYWYVKVPTAGTYNITVDYDDGGLDQWGATNANKVCAVAISGVDLTSEATLFDGAPSAPFIQSQTASKTTTVANTMVVIFSTSTNGSTPDTGFTIISSTAADWFFSEYKINSATGTFNTAGANSLQTIIDAIKQSTTLAINGTPQYATSGKASYVQPTNIMDGEFDGVGTYFCINGPGGSNGYQGSVWRHKLGAGVNGFEKLNGQGSNVSGGGVPLPASGYPSAGSFGNLLAVDPRPAHSGEFFVSQATYVGYQCLNGNAALGSLSWQGSTGLGVGQAPSYAGGDSPWLENLNVNSGAGGACYDPTDGTIWVANGVGCWKYLNPFTPGVDTYLVTIKWVTAGVDNLIAQDVVMGNVFSHPVVIVEDRSALLTAMPNAPSSNAFSNFQGNGTQGDFAWGTQYVAFLEFGGVQPKAGGGWSNDNGATWNGWAVVPPNQVTGGLISVGYYNNSTDANIISVASYDGGFTRQLPYYSLNNGNSWTASTGIGSGEVFTTAQEQRSKLLTNDRNGASVIHYIMGPSTKNVYRSTDFGATWTLRGTVSGLGSSSNGYRFEAIPGHIGDLWASRIQSGTGSYLWYSSDGGANWARVNTDVDQVALLLFGKEAPAASYPTMFLLGSVFGEYGFWRSTNKGVTWTKFGSITDLPRLNQLDYVICGGGDWKTYGSVYYGFVSSSFVQYTL